MKKIALLVLILVGIWLFLPIIVEKEQNTTPRWLIKEHRQQENKLPEWLTLEHRQQKVEAEAVEEVSMSTETTVEVNAEPEITTPTVAAKTTVEEEPKWQQPGTMEYIAKIQLDEKVYQYKNNPNEDDKKLIVDTAAALGVDLLNEYSLDLKVIEKPQDLFYNKQGSGFNNGNF